MQRFTKVEGLGNDFVLIDARSAHQALSPERVVRLCDRHRGIGADGVLVLARSERASAFLEVWNADGSKAEMCGNGLRCAARLLLAEQPGVPELTIETAVGVHRCRPGQGEDEVWVELIGYKLFPLETIEVSGTEAGGVSAGVSLSGRRVRLGNPHFVVFGGADAGRASRLGPALELHRSFAPERTNVAFCEVKGATLRVRVWERGAGLTLACGTGAAAAAAAAWADRHLPTGPTTVELPGGTVRIEPISEIALGLAGPARTVFEGTIGS